MEKTSEQSRWWDWPAILLLFLLLQTVAARLVATDWVPDLSLIQLFATITYNTTLLSATSPPATIVG